MDLVEVSVGRWIVVGWLFDRFVLQVLSRRAGNCRYFPLGVSVWYEVTRGRARVLEIRAEGARVRGYEGTVTVRSTSYSYLQYCTAESQRVEPFSALHLLLRDLLVSPFQNSWAARVAAASLIRLAELEFSDGETRPDWVPITAD